jgi:HPt (histidine-containing phosphotransfer) domain-containing protein
MSELAPVPALLDATCIAEIRQLERKIGRSDVLCGFIRNLEHHLAGFRAAYCDCLERGDAKGAMRAAHTLKGSCLQLGAQALGELFAEIERDAKAGDHAKALHAFDRAAGLVFASLEALKGA